MSPPIGAFTLTQIEYVLAVHRLGHFAKAAAACHVTQPTLSMQILKLEQDLGVKIFDRSKKPILTTDIGEKLIEQMKLIHFEAKKMGDIVSSSSAKVPAGALTVGVIPTVAPYVLPRLIQRLNKGTISLHLTIHEMQTHQVLDALQNDTIDVGLLATPVHAPKIFEYPLFYEPFWILCFHQHEFARLKKIRYSQLKADQMWLLSEGHCLRHQILDICSGRTSPASDERPVQFESGSLETIKRLIASVGGYTLLPQLAADHLGSRLSVVPFERPIPARQIGLVYRREHYKADLIESLGESIIASIPVEVRALRQKDLDVIPVDEGSR